MSIGRPVRRLKFPMGRRVWLGEALIDSNGFASLDAINVDRL